MSLDAFDRTVLEHEGNAQDFMRDIYGITIGPDNAKKQKTAIVRHINYKLENEVISDYEGLNERVINGDGSQISKRLLVLSEDESQDQCTIMRKMGFDPLKWKLNYCKVKRSYHDVTLKLGGRVDEEGERLPDLPHMVTNNAYNCEVSVSPIQNTLTSEMVLSIFDELQPPELAEYPYSSGNKMVELPIMDFHLHNPGWTDFGIKLFKRTVLDILSKLESQNIRPEKFTFPIGQDFFNYDSVDGKTTKGTQLDVDPRWDVMYKSGVELLVWAIEQLRCIAPVDVLYVAGNHDKFLSYAATLHVDAWYKGTDSVKVDTSSCPRKYIEYGIIMIAYSHGVDEGQKRIKTLMQQEAPEMWGRTTFREFHLGHLHSEHLLEEGGIKFRRIPTITETNEWHRNKGYTAMRMAQSFVWDAKTGLDTILNSNVLVK
jgi:hypothetical protein